MNCPACENNMDERDFGGVHVDVCCACKGVWFDIHEIQRLSMKPMKVLARH